MSPLNVVGRLFTNSILMAPQSRDFNLAQACKVRNIAFSKSTMLGEATTCGISIHIGYTSSKFANSLVALPFGELALC
jgi:hypothetical protein